MLKLTKATPTSRPEFTKPVTVKVDALPGDKVAQEAVLCVRADAYPHYRAQRDLCARAAAAVRDRYGLGTATFVASDEAAAAITHTDKEFQRVVAENLIVRWEGVTDDTGQEVEFTPALCMRLFEQYPSVFSDVIDAASTLTIEQLTEVNDTVSK